jgi:sterol desaturase/sphingolipid hydroxylase (fatty acid hydroxylase superfamily)
MFDSWYILLFYWCWAALLQEKLEHNPNVNVFGCTFGKWHLEHHRTPNKNFGLFFPVWDKIFKTESKKLN